MGFADSERTDQNYRMTTSKTRRAAVFDGAQPILDAVTTDGEVIQLRRPQARDIDAIVATCRDPATIRWTTIPNPYQRADAEYFVGEYAHDAWTNGRGAVFVIVNATDRYLGSMELRLSPIDELIADVGFMTAPYARGRGYAPAALDAMCVWSFRALGLVRIEWRAEAGNIASRRAAEKAGFVFEGTARSALACRDGQRADAWVGARLATDPWAFTGQSASEIRP